MNSTPKFLMLTLQNASILKQSQLFNWIHQILINTSRYFTRCYLNPHPDRNNNLKLPFETRHFL